LWKKRLRFILFKENNYNGVIYMTAPNIQTTHAFTTRFGGVSSGVYASMNLAYRADDDPENVKENYSLLCSALGISVNSIVSSRQVHGTFIRVTTRDDCGKLFLQTGHQADGLITTEPEAALMVYTADCVPILLFDPVKNAVGAVHAGWRGTSSNISSIAVQKMKSEFGCSPGDISAAIGPGISKCCYETDSDVADAMKKILPTESICTAAQNGKFMVDLKEANRLLLTQAGVLSITVSNECTSCLSDKYWSHRRLGSNRGTQAAIITPALKRFPNP
jgi:hypothetical protein